MRQVQLTAAAEVNRPMPWDVQFRDGISLPQLGWNLDSHRSVAASFVSHAHSDHVAAHREIICSPGTARLLRERLRGRRIVHALPFGQTERLGADVTITLHPAGHTLGSAQCLLAHGQHGRLLYTGDFKLRPGRSAEVCETPEADLLIMETTFGKPHYRWPPAEEIFPAVIRFCRETLAGGANPVLFAYSLGKSQEILAGLADSGLPLMLHPQSFRFARIYEELGAQFPAYREFSPREAGGHVVICPPQPRQSSFLSRIPARRTAVLSGWALDRGAVYRHGCDAAFALSDHADYPDLLALVERVRPRRVLTVHGFAREFAQDLRARGIEAWALGRSSQMELPSFAPFLSNWNRPLTSTSQPDRKGP